MTETTCPDCGLPHPETNPYCFCKTKGNEMSCAQPTPETASYDEAYDYLRALTLSDALAYVQEKAELRRKLALTSPALKDVE